jgi:alpha-tubulin suppressor-like RCC1 family protein
MEDLASPPNRKNRELLFDSLQYIVSPATKPNTRAEPGETSKTGGTFIFTWGAGYQGQLGLKKKRGGEISSKARKFSTVPVLVDLKVVARKVVCGPTHTCVVSEAGQVWAWGDYTDNDEKSGTDASAAVMDPQAPRLVYFPHSPKIVDIACGDAHSVGLSSDGLVYTWGSNKQSQLGRHPDKQNKASMPLPIKVNDGLIKKKIKQVACGSVHTMLLAVDGTVFGMGSNQHGQTGLGVEERQTMFSALVPNIPPIKEIAAGPLYTCLITMDGKLLVCGFGEHLYQTANQLFSYEPVEVVVSRPADFVPPNQKEKEKDAGEKKGKEKKATRKVVCKQVACGQSHCLVLSEGGNVYAWGDGTYGQLGQGLCRPSSIPQQVLLNKRVARVACGRYHSLAVTTEGVLYSWGCGENGELGDGSDENRAFPEVVTTILGTVVGQLSCGEHHTAVLTSPPWREWPDDVELLSKSERQEADLKRKFLEKHPNATLSGTALGRLSHALSQDQARTQKAAEVTKEEERMAQTKMLDSILSPPKLRMTLTEGDLPPVRVPVSPGGQGDPDLQQARKRQHALRSPPPRTIAVRRLRRVGSASDLPELIMTPQGGGAARATFLNQTVNAVESMKMMVQEKGASRNKEEVRELRRTLYMLRTQYDALHNDWRKKDSTYKENDKENKLLLRAEALSEEAWRVASERKMELNTKLNTVTIKTDEQATNRKNYEANIGFLKTEAKENTTQLQHLQRRMHEIGNLERKVDEVYTKALAEKSKADAEVTNFAKEIQHHQSFVRVQRDRFLGVLGTLKQDKQARDEAVKARGEQRRQKVRQRAAKLQDVAEATEKKQADLQGQLQEYDSKLEFFAARFRKITMASGETDAEAIIQKFLSTSAQEATLQKDMENKQMLLKELKQEHEDRKEFLVEARNKFRESRLRDVSVLKEQSRKTEHMHNKHKEALLKARTNLAVVQEGLLSIASLYASVKDGQATEAVAEPAPAIEPAVEPAEGEEAPAVPSAPATPEELKQLGGEALWTEEQLGKVFALLEQQAQVVTEIARKVEEEKLAK